MASPASRPCEPWKLLPATEEEADWFEEQQDAVLIYDELQMLATEILWARSGRRYGVCSYTIRPCGARTPCPDEDLWDVIAWPTMWPQGAMCGCVGRCGHGGAYLRLPRPVAAVSEVLVDGVEVEADLYEVVQWRWLHRLDGESWPATQDLSLPTTDADTFSVSFSRGYEATTSARRMMTILFRQLLTAIVDPAACRLPGNLLETFRKGVRTGYIDSGLLLVNSYNRIGIAEIDLWLTSVNPYGKTRKSRVYRADARG